jgi:hypothetical protein
MNKTVDVVWMEDELAFIIPIVEEDGVVIYDKEAVAEWS